MAMNGFNNPQLAVTQQLPADSSGIINMSSPSGSSDSGSSGIELRQTRLTAGHGVVTSGKNMNLMAKVQKMNPSKSVVAVESLSPKKLSSSVEERQKTDLFLSQFQAQMSQMKSAMDAVQHEMLVHKSSALKPVRGGAGRGRGVQITESRRGRGRGRGRSISTIPSAVNVLAQPGATPSSVMYQSQISASNGLKLKIRKSPNHSKRGAHLRGHKRGKMKRRKGDEDEDDVSDMDTDVHLVARPSSSGDFVINCENGDQSAGTKPSGWGDQLPEDILIKIFSMVVKDDGCIPFLVRATKVCRLWRKVASKPELWTSIDLTSARIKDVYRSERNLAYLLEYRFFHVRHLNLGGWSSAVTSATVDILVKNCKSLESLFVSSCQKLTGSNLKTITDSCPSLQKLDLSAISAAYNTKSAVSPSAIGDAAEVLGPRLTHLSLANNCLPSCPQIVYSLAEYCPNLEVLDLSNVTSPRRDTIIIRVETLQQGCPVLRVLRLTNTEIALSETSLKDQASSPGFPKLEELSLAVDPKRCQGMDDSDLERIVKSSIKLRLLDVRGCTKISDSGLVRVPAWDLEHLYLSGCFATKSSNDGLELIVRKWKHSFKEIDFAWTPNEDAINLAIKALAEKDDNDLIPPVKKLDLLGSSVSFDCVKVALSTCTYLVSLNLTSCRALPRGIKRNYPTPWDVATLREQILSGKYDENINEK
ncbi:unnamed protein product [Allacma fusca]|uniref:F-box domain-containing protein n=1 Tax=Allacma fusca TaxID=39272 RepID=A0A8J2PT78_9HEXA|nr:unnamed protein product [Allacma fusca]